MWYIVIYDWHMVSNQSESRCMNLFTCTHWLWRSKLVSYTICSDARTLKQSLNRGLPWSKSLEVDACNSCEEVFYLKLCVIMVRVLLLMRGFLIKIQAFVFSQQRKLINGSETSLLTLLITVITVYLQMKYFLDNLSSKRSGCTFSALCLLVVNHS